jgi:hypothetical protein
LIPGDPILDEFDPFPAAGPVRGVSSTPFYSTMAEIEIQFSILSSTDPVNFIKISGPLINFPKYW